MSEMPEPATLLFVDDEPGILSSLRRGNKKSPQHVNSCRELCLHSSVLNRQVS